jgi:hypothetical protein
MSVRVWASPPVSLNGGTAFIPKAEQYCTGGARNFFPTNPDGTPASTWIITIGKAVDWTTASADAALVDVFAGDLPGTINSRDDLIAYLRIRTVGDVPIARRQTIQAQLDTLVVPRADFTLTTPLWKVFQRVISTLSEKDSNFAAGFNL